MAHQMRTRRAREHRPLTDAETSQLQHASGDALAKIIAQLQADRVTLAAIGQALGHGGSWMTKHFPQP